MRRDGACSSTIFVLVEATTTFSGEPKPLYFAEARARFARWADKIVHVVVDDMPKGADAWDAERFQRDACVRGIETAAPDDLILLSDVDEIPKPEVLARVIEEREALRTACGSSSTSIASTSSTGAWWTSGWASAPRAA